VHILLRVHRLFLLKVAGISFTFDPTKPAGKRVPVGSVMVGDEPLDLEKTYRLCVTDFVAQGRDGYDCLVGCKMIVNEEDGPLLSTVVQNHFQSVSYLTGLCKFKYCHHQSIIARRVRRSMSRPAANAQEEEGASAIIVNLILEKC